MQDTTFRVRASSPAVWEGSKQTIFAIIMKFMRQSQLSVEEHSYGCDIKMPCLAAMKSLEQILQYYQKSDRGYFDGKLSITVRYESAP